MSAGQGSGHGRADRFSLAEKGTTGGVPPVPHNSPERTVSAR